MEEVGGKFYPVVYDRELRDLVVLDGSGGRHYSGLSVVRNCSCKSRDQAQRILDRFAK